MVLFGGFGAWLVARPNYRELTFGDVTVTGKLNWLGANGELFSLRVKGLEAAPVSIVIGGRRLTLNGVIPAELLAVGFQEGSGRSGGRATFFARTALQGFSVSNPSNVATPERTPFFPR